MILQTCFTQVLHNFAWVCTVDFQTLVLLSIDGTCHSQKGYLLCTSVDNLEQTKIYWTKRKQIKSFNVRFKRFFFQ